MKTQSLEEWESYLNTLLRDGVPSDHVDILRAKGRHLFAEEVRNAMRRGARKATNPRGSKIVKKMGQGKG